MSGRQFRAGLALSFIAAALAVGCSSFKKKAPTEPVEPRVLQCIDIVTKIYEPMLQDAYGMCIGTNSAAACRAEEKQCRQEIEIYCRTAAKLYAYDLVRDCLERKPEET